ncbi:MAG: acetyl-CoA acetyltransferase [Smithellaceae bacterium]
MESIKDKIAIIGMGCSQFGELWNKGAEDLIVEAAYEAYQDAGVEPKDIQAAWVSTAMTGRTGASLAAPLKLHYIPVTRIENACASALDALRNAVFAVASKQYDVVLALGFEKLKDIGRGGLPAAGDYFNHPIIGTPYNPPNNFALMATRYFHTYGVGRETLAKIVVKNHYNGSLSPKAHFRNRVTQEQALNSSMICWPLGLFDACGVSDGAAAAIITRADLAKNFRGDPIYIKGIGIAASAGMPEYMPGFDYVHWEHTVQAAKQCYEQAGIKNPRKEIDIAQVHDCFTITELVTMEDLGFCERGKANQDVDAGTFELTGELPVNTDGGLKCFGHPIGASGLRMTYEIYKQLQGKAGERQIKKAPRRGLIHNIGGAPFVCGVMALGNEKG